MLCFQDLEINNELIQATLSSQIIVTYLRPTTLGNSTPEIKVRGANMGPTWGLQDPGGSHFGPVILVIWDSMFGITRTKV